MMEPSIEIASEDGERMLTTLSKPLDPALLEANSPLRVPSTLYIHSFSFLFNFKAKLFRKGYYYFQPKGS